MSDKIELFDKLCDKFFVDLKNGSTIQMALVKFFNESRKDIKNTPEESKVIESDDYIRGSQLSHVVKFFQGEIDGLKTRISALETSQTVYQPNQLPAGLFSNQPNIAPFPANMEEEILRKVKELEDKVRSKDWNEGLE